MPPVLAKPRKDFTADALFRLTRSYFGRMDDPRQGKISILLGDALMSAFAMFSLKDPSLLAFDERCRNQNDNFRTMYGIESVPSDTQMRAILDTVDPDNLRPLYNEIFRLLQRGKELEQFVFMDGHYLVSLDGTGYFSSSKIHCPSCLEKKYRDGKVNYSHQMLGAALVKPGIKEVIPLAPEPIIQQDGHIKNDCEKNATRRWLKRFRQDHPHLPVIILEDGLSANAPHLNDLLEAKARYIIGVKPGDHAFLFGYLRTAEEEGKAEILIKVDPLTGIQHEFRFQNNVPLNESHPDHKVNVLEYREIHPTRVVKKVERIGIIQNFSWITDFELTTDTVEKIMRGGRARWKIENETFNTLKNQGYHFEHNYGHGKKSLSVVLAMVMMLAFLVDQTQQLCCPLFQAAWATCGHNKRSLWNKVRCYFLAYTFDSMQDLLVLIAGENRTRRKCVKQNSS